MTCRGCDTPIPTRRAGAGGKQRVWCSDRCRKTTLYSEPCEDCGKPHGGRANARGGGGPASRFCVECGHRRSNEAQRRYGDAIRSELSALWLEGLPIREIARVMAWTPGSAGTQIVRYRGEGFEDEFPLRNRVSAEGRRRISDAAKRTRAAEHRKAA